MKQQGFCITPKEVKKICGKAFGRKNGYTFWRDSDGYFYFAYTRDLPNKKNKEEWEKFHDRDEAQFIWLYSGNYHNRSCFWCLPDELEQIIRQAKAETPKYARDIEVKVAKQGYHKLKPENRKVICRLPYFDMESLYCGEDKPLQRPLLFLCRDWNKICDKTWCKDNMFDEFLMDMYKFWLERTCQVAII